MSDRLGPPPIETLSDIAWARVERDLWTKLDSEPDRAVRHPPSGQRRWAWLAVPLVAAAAIAIVLLAQDSPATEIADNGLQRVVAGAAPTTISSNDAHIVLDAETALVLDRATTKPRVVVERGAAWFTVTPREAHHPFSVVAGDAIVQVIGTRFRVSRSAERIEVTVDHGVVRVMFRGDEAIVRARQQWSSDAPLAVVAIAAAPATGTGTVVAADLTETPAGVASSTAVADSALNTAPPLAGSAVGKPASVDAGRVRFDHFTALETRDPNAAIAGYIELAQRPSRWAEVALFAAGRLAADRRDRRAESLLTKYLQRFPNGLNATDARHLLDVLKAHP